jgi:hypothetical protein
VDTSEETGVIVGVGACEDEDEDVEEVAVEEEEEEAAVEGLEFTQRSSSKRDTSTIYLKEHTYWKEPRTSPAQCQATKKPEGYQPPNLIKSLDSGTLYG